MRNYEASLRTPSALSDEYAHQMNFQFHSFESNQNGTRKKHIGREWRARDVEGWRQPPCGRRPNTKHPVRQAECGRLCKGCKKRDDQVDGDGYCRCVLRLWLLQIARNMHQSAPLAAVSRKCRDNLRRWFDTKCTYAREQTAGKSVLTGDFLFRVTTFLLIFFVTFTYQFG